jgi:hypothetical protein
MIQVLITYRSTHQNTQCTQKCQEHYIPILSWPTRNLYIMEPTSVMGRASVLYLLTILWELGRYLYLSLSPPRVIFFHIHSHLTNQASLSSIDAPNHLCPKLSDSLR